MTPEQIELLENSRLYQLGKKTEAEFIRKKFEIREKYAHRVTLIIYIDGSKVCRYNRHIVQENNVDIVAYPEISIKELQELKDENTTLARVRAILDSLTFGVCAVGDLRAQNYRATPNFKRSYTAANCT